ncbi:GumC family protein [Aquimarina sp. W85]|uniref:GumC family protein n=1 Tax=Aquimarina rhodophyticola TaxID=3342246 RepID=UPI003671E37D
MKSSENNQNVPVLSTTKNADFNFREQIIHYLKRWYWFLLGLVVCLALAYTYIRYTIPKYNVSASIMISQDDSMGESELAAFQDLGLLENNTNKIENEIQIIKSRTLITNVVKRLRLNIQYFTKGRVLETENYPESIVEISLLAPDSIIQTASKVFKVNILSDTKFSLLNDNDETVSEHSFGNTIKTSIGDVVITPNFKNVGKHKGQTIKIKISPIKWIAESYRNGLSISPVGKNSSVLQIAINDPVKEKAMDIINTLIDEYNKATINDKKQTSARTATFINDRLDLISGDLTEVDDEAAGYKAKFGLTNDISAQTQRVADSDTRNLQEITQLSTQLSLIESTRSFILSQEGRYDLVPANLGFDDPNITNTATRYNTLISQRNRLLTSSSEQNPAVININQQIDGLRQVLIESLNSLKGAINIKLNSLKTQDRYFSGKLYNAPIRQKDLRVIEREQTIKEQLYLYLLQKREEAEITSHVTLSNARVIDRATTIGSYPVSPNKKMIYVGAVFVGLMIPFLVIYISELLNVKVRSRQDLEKVLTMPILGSIPKTKSNDKIVVSRTNRSGIAEAFRILRTNLDFLMAGSNKNQGKVIFVTSTISGEGKTLVSSNLAKTLAISGKKIAFIGTDFRDPKFHNFLDLPKGKDTEGFTNFIMNKDLKPQDVIYSDKSDDPMDILPPGVIPPNPAELLMQDRVGEMFSYLQAHYDYIIVDTAPVSLVTDTLLIGHYSDLSIFIVRENYSDKRALQVPENFHREKRLPNMAVLLNASFNQGGYGYGYGYGYGNKGS